MKKFILVLTVLSMSSAFAGSFTKLDTGSVTWSIDLLNPTQEGKININRTGQEINSKDQITEEMLTINHHVLGGTTLMDNNGEKIVFENTTSGGSAEIAKAFLKEKLALNVLTMNVEIKAISVNFNSLSCSETRKGGLFKKKQAHLACSADFSSTIQATFKAQEQ